MERTIRALFDYQKFEGSPDLQRIIDAVHGKYEARELTMDEMEWVAAAGQPVPPVRKENSGEKQ